VELHARLLTAHQAHLQDAQQNGPTCEDLMESGSWLDWSTYPLFGAEPNPADMNDGPSFQLMVWLLHMFAKTVCCSGKEHQENVWDVSSVGK
jgi:hypothetical protein